MNDPIPSKLHLWFPNIFEFKGGIQVYLRDFLNVLASEFPESSIVMFDKIDKSVQVLMQVLIKTYVSFIIYKPDKLVDRVINMGTYRI